MIASRSPPGPITVPGASGVRIEGEDPARRVRRRDRSGVYDARMRGKLSTLAVAVLGCACGPRAVSTTDGTSNQVAVDYGDADLVAFDDQGAVFYAVGDQLRVVARVPFELGGDEVQVSDAVWVPRGAVYVVVGPRRVLRVTFDGAVPVAVPGPDELREATIESEYEGPGSYDPGFDYHRLSGDAAGVWYGVCAETYENEELECGEWRWARIDPPGGDQPVDARSRPSDPWPTTRPSGVTIHERRDDADVVVALDCVDAGGAAEVTPGEGAVLMAYAWVSSDPPRLLTISGDFGLDDYVPYGWELHDGCGDVVDRGAHADPGPDGLWLGTRDDDDGPHTFVYRGGARIGELPEGAAYFRPAR